MILLLGLLLAGLPLLVTAFLLARYRFEAFISWRYLGRRTPPGRRPKIALALSLALIALSLGLLFTGAHQGGWVWTGAALLFVAGFAALASAMLLYVSLFTTVSAVGLALGVAALLVVMAVTGGFRRDFLDRLTAFHGHAVVRIYGEPTAAEVGREIAELRRKLEGLPDLVSTSTFAVTAADVSIGPAAAGLKAIDPREPEPPLARWMVEGDLAALGKPASCGAAQIDHDQHIGHLVLGRPLAQRLRAKVGDCVQIVVPFGRPGQLQPVPLTFQLVGIFEMGYHLHDARLAYVSVDDLPLIESQRPFIYGVELHFADPMAVEARLPEIEARVGIGYSLLDWRLLGQSIFSAVETQRLVIGFFLAIIIVVSAFNLMASLIIVVLVRTREIAVLGALGARRTSQLVVFVIAGGLTGLLGLATGLAAGGGICWLLSAYHFKLEAAVYMISELPVDLEASHVLFVAGIAQLSALLATIPPVIRARRLTVTEGLRQV